MFAERRIIANIATFPYEAPSSREDYYIFLYM